MKSVLISGIGIAGPTLAYWLHRYGFKPTLVEQAPSLRQGGYMIDFWGRGFDVAERMGLLPAIRSNSYQIEEVRLVDDAGKKVGGFSADVFRKLLGDRFISIERGVLAELIFERVKQDAEAIFNDTLVSIERSGAEVGVHFKNERPRTFDLVVGADGLHSNVRSLLFGANRPFETPLGFKVAAFVASGYRHRDEGAYVSYCVPGKQIARYALRDNRTGFLFVFRATGRSSEFLNDEEKRALLQETFSGVGWECAEILRALDTAPEFYFDDVSQVRMPAWFRGRAALVGDAAFCPSLLAGEGSSLAMSAAYLLAGELKRSGGNVEQAFQRYEELFKPSVERKQKAAIRLGGWFAPKTRLGLVARNATTGLMNIPVIARWTIGHMIADQFDLPDYDQVN